MNITFVHLERANSLEKIINCQVVKQEPKFMVHIKQLNIKNAFIHNTIMFHFTDVIDAVVRINEYVKDHAVDNLVFDCESINIFEGENLGKIIIKNIKMDYDVYNSLLVKLVDQKESFLQ